MLICLSSENGAPVGGYAYGFAMLLSCLNKLGSQAKGQSMKCSKYSEFHFLTNQDLKFKILCSFTQGISLSSIFQNFLIQFKDR